MVLKYSVFNAEINDVNVGLNGKMNEIFFSQILDYRQIDRKKTVHEHGK